MLILKFWEKEWRFCDKWQDLTIRQAARLQDVVSVLPSNFIEILRLTLFSDKDDVSVKDKITELQNGITLEENLKVIPQIYGDIINVLTDIDRMTIDKILPGDRVYLVNNYLLKFVVGVIFTPIDFIAHKNKKQFTFKGETYNIPQSEYFKISGNVVEKPLPNTTAIEFTEAADLSIAAEKMKGGKIKSLPNIISILCRKDNEVYNETVSLKRAEMFEDLDMQTAFEVFFCLLMEFGILKTLTRLFMQK